jgi:hypothetical protein
MPASFTQTSHAHRRRAADLNVYLTAGLPVVLDLALEVDLLGEGGPTQKADALFPLSKEGFKHHVIDELWRVKAATSAKSIGTAIIQRHRD